MCFTSIQAGQEALGGSPRAGGEDNRQGREEGRRLREAGIPVEDDHIHGQRHKDREAGRSHVGTGRRIGAEGRRIPPWEGRALVAIGNGGRHSIHDGGFCHGTLHGSRREEGCSQWEGARAGHTGRGAYHTACGIPESASGLARVGACRAASISIVSDEYNQYHGNLTLTSAVQVTRCPLNSR